MRLKRRGASVKNARWTPSTGKLQNIWSSVVFSASVSTLSGWHPNLAQLLEKLEKTRQGMADKTNGSVALTPRRAGTSLNSWACAQWCIGLFTLAHRQILRMASEIQLGRLRYFFVRKAVRYAMHM
jgi:hypothetical protein